MPDNSQDSDASLVAASISLAYLRNVLNRRGAILVAKRFCKCGASIDDIERLAEAIERRAMAFNAAKGGHGPSQENHATETGHPVTVERSNSG